MNRHLINDVAEVTAGLDALNKTFSGQHILLTGAAGFLGSHFVHYFLRLNDTGVLAKPCHLTAVDNFIRGVPKWLSGIRARTDLTLVERDIKDAADLPGVDYIIHAASIASPTFYRQHPIETMDANVIGLRNLLDHVVKNPVKKFLYLSTSEIYGDPDPLHIPTEETYRGNVSCIGPRACYDESKRFGETLCVNFAGVRNVPVTIVRPFNNYGPGLRITDRRVVPDLFRDLMAGGEMVLLSNGRATRTFCYVADAIQGYLRVLLLGRSGEAYNIGTEGPEINMTTLAELVAKSAGMPRLIRYQVSEDGQYLTDNPQRRCPSVEKARREVGFKPAVSLEAGLERTYAYYRENPGD
jgi:nucleoside-diphosphate-sugar epimerase